ncbi:MAG: single-stranded DNA-binding protein [Patescibacteria group bacterium]|jgi:single-strand DNA-binding protein
MAGLNTYAIVGWLVKDPELSYTSSGKAVCRLTIAWSGREKTVGEKVYQSKLFIPATVWGKSAEFVAEHGKKGIQVVARGELLTSSWEKDGQKHSMTQLNVQEISIIWGKKKEAKEEVGGEATAEENA